MGAAQAMQQLATVQCEFDVDSVQKIQTRSQVRLDLWAIRRKSPTGAVAGPLRRTDDGAGRAQSSATGGGET